MSDLDRSIPRQEPEAGVDQSEFADFAQALRAAHPDPVLDATWHRHLEQRLDTALQQETPWGWRHSLEGNPWMRLAAALLLMAVVAAPVSAVFGLLHAPPAPKPDLSFDPVIPDLAERHAAAREAEGADGLHGIRPPQELDAEAPQWTAATVLALQRSNRLALAAQAWQDAGAVASSLRAHAERLDRRDSPQQDWSQATPDQLFDAFLRRVAHGAVDLPDPKLLESVESRLAAGASTSVPAGLAAWHWVATGEVLPGPSRGWAEAPFRP